MDRLPLASMARLLLVPRTGPHRHPCALPWWGRTSRRRSPRESWPGLRSTSGRRWDTTASDRREQSAKWPSSAGAANGPGRVAFVHNPSHSTWAARATRSRFVQLLAAAVLAIWLTVWADLLPAELGELESNEASAFPRVRNRISLARSPLQSNRYFESHQPPPPDHQPPLQSSKNPYPESVLSFLSRADLGFVSRDQIITFFVMRFDGRRVTA